MSEHMTDDSTRLMFLPKIQKPRSILFDLGDTLINFSATNPIPYISEGTGLAYQFMVERGVRLPSFKSYLRSCCQETYLAAFIAELRRREVDLLATMRHLHHKLRLPCGEEFLLALAERFYEPMKKLGTVEEGLHALLDDLIAAKHPMAIVSNTMVPAKVLDQHLEEVGLLKYFPVRIYSCDVGLRKPRPQMFLLALRALNAKPQGTLFIGDKTHLDVKGANKLGMTTILKVRSGPVPRGRHRPDHVIRHLSELPGLLDTIGRQCADTTLTLPQDEMMRQRKREHISRQPKLTRTA